MLPRLCDADRRALLVLARTAITESTLSDRIPDGIAPSGRLSEPGSAFVTLFHKGRLRGCVGMTGRNLSLAESVIQAAVSAARNDPRFAAITASELPEVDIEISVLSEPLPVLPGVIEAGRHGLLIVRGKNRGLLLPQVAAQYSWSSVRFLEETCRKAGLEAGAWRNSETQIFAFTAEVFSERELRLSSVSDAQSGGK